MDPTLDDYVGSTDPSGNGPQGPTLTDYFNSTANLLKTGAGAWQALNPPKPQGSQTRATSPTPPPAAAAAPAWKQYLPWVIGGGLVIGLVVWIAKKL